ncbi:Outer membrane protein assembly factor BamE [Candidatus Erwinia haradaeae]|uniref:Outer membrane protein assembly factor BamE n=1 Tax=Candidatus Erwinia haradaeae TaxID=1922217 RepID=A0A451CYS4_9GAMM|nr:outer membrane protein assembly factor BamE [Candidatus Erwinia haradaeae]VFP78429.1 Outer membrane protein assembly factor BamE [Candidatus Erwinia haradaeae]
MLRYKSWIAPILLLIISSSCSTIDQVLYRNNLNQGDCLTTASIEKIRIGMTKQQISYLLGRPMIHNSSQSNIWHYVCRRESRYQTMNQQVLTLTFNQNDILMDIESKEFRLIKGDSCK